METKRKENSQYGGDENQTLRTEICPQCGESVIQPRDSEDYCEECGWPDENREPIRDGSKEHPYNQEDLIGKVTLKSFYITFGQQYRREPHPKAKDVHPDGVFKIVALDMFEARKKAFSRLGQQWHQCLTQKEWDKNSHYFPKGVIKTL